jgi:hypothetical protein
MLECFGRPKLSLRALQSPYRTKELATGSLLLARVTGLSIGGTRFICNFGKTRTIASELATMHYLQAVGPLIIPEGMRIEARSVDGTADYGSQLLAFSRVRLLKDPSDGFDGIQCLEKRILRLDLVWESFAAQELSGWKGPKHFDLLMTPRNATRDERFEEGENLV